MYSAMGAAVSAEMLEWYRKEYGFEAKAKAVERGCADWDTLMEEAAASPPGSRGVIFLPALWRARAVPRWTRGLSAASWA